MAASLAPLVAAGAGAGGAAAAGAGIFAAGGIGTTIVGGLLAGFGTAMASKKAREAEEASRIAEEKRRQDSYEGAADATRFWEDPLQQGEENQAAGPNAYERADPNSNAGLAVGQREERKMPGEKYRMPEAPQKPTVKYNPQTRQIERV